MWERPTTPFHRTNSVCGPTPVKEHSAAGGGCTPPGEGDYDRVGCTSRCARTRGPEPRLADERRAPPRAGLRHKRPWGARPPGAGGHPALARRDPLPVSPVDTLPPPPRRRERTRSHPALHRVGGCCGWRLVRVAARRARAVPGGGLAAGFEPVLVCCAHSACGGSPMDAARRRGGRTGGWMVGTGTALVPCLSVASQHRRFVWWPRQPPGRLWGGLLALVEKAQRRYPHGVQIQPPFDAAALM